LIVEVKTTDVYSVHLEDLAGYKEDLVSADRVGRNSSILVVVGRTDTNALEAQVRGSRYAWEMGLISVEALIKLVQIKEKSDDPETLGQIRRLLQPFEYTKLDKIIEVVFTTAIDVESQEETADDEQETELSTPTAHQIRTEFELLNAKRAEAVDAFARSKGTELIRRSRTLFWSADRDIRVCCAISKRYDRDYQPYWYGYHVKWDEFLREGKDSYLILSCMDRDDAFAIPYSWISANTANLNKTERGERNSYWHIALATLDNGNLAINPSRLGKKIDLKPYRFSFETH
jgi:hypothetical protein